MNKFSIYNLFKKLGNLLFVRICCSLYNFIEKWSKNNGVDFEMFSVTTETRTEAGCEFFIFYFMVIRTVSIILMRQNQKSGNNLIVN